MNLVQMLKTLCQYNFHRIGIISFQKQNSKFTSCDLYVYQNFCFIVCFYLDVSKINGYNNLFSHLDIHSSI